MQKKYYFITILFFLFAQKSFTMEESKFPVKTETFTKNESAFYKPNFFWSNIPTASITNFVHCLKNSRTISETQIETIVCSAAHDINLLMVHETIDLCHNF